MATDPVALVRTISSTTKVANAVKGMWDARTKIRATLNEGTALDMVIRAQIDEVFLVLAHLGEAILPLGVFNKDYYLQTLGEVQASIASCGNELLPMAWAELDAELQYVCTAGFTICACYAPMPAYRGFGACVLGDWDWACPDMAYLEEKARKKAIRTVYGFKQKVDPQPTRSVFVAFDSAIQILQVKPMAFLAKRPLISGFAEHQPRYGPKPKKEVKDDLDWIEEWLKQLERRGHPAPKGTKLTSWGIPFATWTSPYSCRVLRTHKECETIVLNQMDPGRLLHAFICRGSANLDDGQILSLPPRSPAESLMCWLEGLPGTSHKIVKWHDLDTEYFEKKVAKSLRKKIGQYPLPTQFAIRDPEAATRPSLPLSASSPAVLEHPNTVSPPPYSPSVTEVRNHQAQPTAELGSPDPRELPASPVQSPPPHVHHSASLPLPRATATTGLKSIHTLRRNPTAPQPNKSSASSAPENANQSTVTALTREPQQISGPSNMAELHEETVQSKAPTFGIPSAVELPTDFHSEAPEFSAFKDTEVEKLPDTSDSGSAHKAKSAEDLEDVKTVETPLQTMTTESIRKLGTSETKEDSHDQIRSSPNILATSNGYLELLNKVAKGEISPQALSEMLQKGELGQQNTHSGVGSAPVEPQLAESANEPVKLSQEQSGSLPYPISPTERKNRDWQEQNRLASGAPYPETPIEKRQTPDAPSGSNGDEVPASLRLGGG